MNASALIAPQGSPPQTAPGSGGKTARFPAIPLAVRASFARRRMELAGRSSTSASPFNPTGGRSHADVLP